MAVRSDGTAMLQRVIRRRAAPLRALIAEQPHQDAERLVYMTAAGHVVGRSPARSAPRINTQTQETLERLNGD